MKKFSPKYYYKIRDCLFIEENPDDSDSIRMKCNNHDSGVFVEVYTIRNNDNELFRLMTLKSKECDLKRSAESKDTSKKAKGVPRETI